MIISKKTTKVSGALGKYFTVVEGEHMFKTDGEFRSFGKLTIGLKRNNLDFPFEAKYINTLGQHGYEKFHVGISGSIGLISIT